jgi:hypothetical protein
MNIYWLGAIGLIAWAALFIQILKMVRHNYDEEEKDLAEYENKHSR